MQYFNRNTSIGGGLICWKGKPSIHFVLRRRFMVERRIFCLKINTYFRHSADDKSLRCERNFILCVKTLFLWPGWYFSLWPWIPINSRCLYMVHFRISLFDTQYSTSTKKLNFFPFLWSSGVTLFSLTVGHPLIDLGGIELPFVTLAYTCSSKGFQVEDPLFL